MKKKTLKIFAARKYTNLSYDSYSIWMYIIAESKVDAKNIFINLIKNNPTDYIPELDDYLGSWAELGIRKLLDLYREAEKWGWKIQELRNITYSGKQRGIKTDLVSNKFTWKA